MKAQDFADMHQVWCAWDGNGNAYWYLTCPEISYMASQWIIREGKAGQLPPDIERPEGDWTHTLVCPTLDASQLVVDQPIMVRDWPDSTWQRRYFAEYKDGRVHAFGLGATSWTNDGRILCGWLQWRLPTEEEMRRKQ